MAYKGPGFGAKIVGSIASNLASGLNSAAKYVGAGQAANAASAAAQQKAADFNQGSADNANAINQATLASQYGFNSGQWAEAANWNESMFNASMAFNAEQAELQRQWIERMESTKYQRAIKDMKAAGLNPVLAATGGGISVGGGGGGAASVSAPSMGAASGGLLGANDASISGYTGQMEYYSGLMGMIGGFMNSMSSAFKNLSGMPAETLKELSTLLDKSTYEPKNWFYTDEGSIADKALDYLGIQHNSGTAQLNRIPHSGNFSGKGHTKGSGRK